MEITDLSSIQCWDFIQKNQEKYCLIDVRTEDEWKETGVPDLSSINSKAIMLSIFFSDPTFHINDHFIEELEEKIQDKSTHLFFICRSGQRSLKAAQMAIKNGYNNVYNINDGLLGNMLDNNSQNLKLNGWLNSNLPRIAL